MTFLQPNVAEQYKEQNTFESASSRPHSRNLSEQLKVERLNGVAPELVNGTKLHALKCREALINDVRAGNKRKR